MKNRNLCALLTAVLLFIGILSGCSVSSPPSLETNGVPESSAPANSQGAASEDPSVPGELYDPFGKFDPMVTYHVARVLDADTTFESGEDLEHNVWADLYRDELGIDLKYDWTVTGDAFEQKVMMSIAAKDVPDMISQITLIMFQELVAGDWCEDLTDAFNNYATPQLKLFASQQPDLMDVMTIDGKLLGLPKFGSEVIYTVGQVLYYRQDWLDTLGLQPPETLQDVLKLAEEFTKADLYGNGQTIGFAISKELYNTGVQDLIGFFAGNDAYINHWLDDGKGGLKYSSIEPEVKESLMMLHDLYSKGIIDSEFVVKDRWKVSDDASAGRVGVMYGGGWSPLYASKTQLADPSAKWTMMRPPSNKAGEGAKLCATSEALNKTYCFVRKGVKNPEALIKMVNVAAEIQQPNGIRASVEEFKKYRNDATGGKMVYPEKYIFVDAAPSDVFFYDYDLTRAAFDDPTITDRPDILDKAKLLHLWTDEQNPEGLEAYYFFGGPNSINGIFQDHAATGNMFFFDRFSTFSTDTMLDVGASLNRRQLEAFTKVIVEGKESIFDDFVAEWLAIGGQDITKEVNEWWAANKP